MAYKEDHNLFVGGKYGSFKGLQCSFEKVLSKNLQNVNFINSESHITVMKWGDEEEKELLLATANQTVKVYDTEYKSFIESIPAQCGEGPIVGVTRYKGVLVTAVQSGEIRVWRPSDSNEIVLDPEDLDLQLSPSNEAKVKADINAGGNLCCMQHSPFNKNIIGTGGQGNDLKLWDLTTKERIFSAKNLPDDAVRLTEPIWVSDIAFLAQKNVMAVCGRYGYVRLYDSKAQRKPVWALKVPEQALTCMAISDEVNLICGLAKGDMLMLDLRMRKLVHKYKGFLGAVRSIACHPTAPYIASASLDRHVRIHHRDTKELLVKEYLKLPLHCVVMRSNADFTVDGEARKPQKRKPDVEDTDLQEYDEMLNSLEKVEDRSSKKVKKLEKSKPVLFINPFASSNTTPQMKISKGNGSLHGNDDKNDSEDDDEDGSNEDELDGEEDELDDKQEEEEDDDENSDNEDELSENDQDDESDNEGSDNNVDENDDSDCLVLE